MISNRCTTGVVLALISALAIGSGLSDATDGLGSLLTGGATMGARQGPGMLGALSGAGAMASQSLANAGAAAGASSALTGGDAGLVGNSMRMAQGFAGGMASAMGAGMGDIGRNIGFGDGMNGGYGGPFGGFGNPMARNFKRSLGASSSAASSAAGSSGGSSAASSAAASASGGAGAGPADMLAPSPMGMGMGMGPSDAAMAAAASGAMGGEMGASAMDAAAAASAAGAGPAAAAGNALAAANSVAASNAASAVELAAASAPVVGRQALALDALRNAQVESALAGSEMAAHGDNNARSAAIASNAYRQAKLASARDRVNIAGTIQNSARISDAAIATHDAATKAEDSLLGSELAVDSAATVLDSDGAYIPPVTSSLLRSLPYGRLGLRNIIPKPLTHPSPGLPDVWLNGYPVSYGNVPLRSLAIPFGYNPAVGLAVGTGSQAVFAAANGGAFFNQPFTSNNGLVLNGMVFDPAYAYLTTNLNGVVGNSELPIIANGQLEAQDEIAMANLLQMQQLNGFGMSTTYQGYGRLNPVPMITGSVTDANLMPTTTIGTTYPIGSTLVIEPRDSFFQDYNDNASSKQNFDERQQ